FGLFITTNQEVNDETGQNFYYWRPTVSRTRLGDAKGRDKSAALCRKRRSHHRERYETGRWRKTLHVAPRPGFPLQGRCCGRREAGRTAGHRLQIPPAGRSRAGTAVQRAIAAGGDGIGTGPDVGSPGADLDTHQRI